MALTSFRGAMTCLSASALLTVIVDWLGQHQFQSIPPRQAIDTYVLEHASSPHVLFCIVSIVLLCAFQVMLVWKTQLAHHWWAAILTESALCVAFAVAYHQVFGRFGFSCGPSPGSCYTWWPRLIQGSGWVVFAIIGLALGLAWSILGRRDHSLAPS
jgi:hypothetical protein